MNKLLSSLEYFKDKIKDHNRNLQAEFLNDAIEKNFNFDYLECIETGCSSGKYDNFGLFFSKLCQINNGKFSTVDLSIERINESKNLYMNEFGDFNIEFSCSDSVDYLKNYKGRPNIVHLDSFDLDLTNPIPSMLHCWLEFCAIKDKIPSGGICVIDDNFLKNTWVDWIESIDGITQNTKKIDITYDIIGKGSLIYHWIKQRNTDWVLLEEYLRVGINNKLIIVKK